MTIYAWVTLVMLDNDNYIHGAISLAGSLRAHNTKYDLICMVTPDISDKARIGLSKLFDTVRVVEYITTEAMHDTDKRHSAAFRRCILTRWQCLGFVEYDKVCLVDADVTFRKNPDNLFDLHAPAGTFSHPWFSERDQHYVEYGDLAHGSIHSQGKIENIYRNKRYGFVPWGSVILLQPSQETLGRISNGPVIDAHPTCLSRYDELSIVNAHDGSTLWTHISPLYHLITWKKYAATLKDSAIGVHFRGPVKPWHRNEADCWKDELLFWEHYRNAIFKYKIDI